MWTGVGWGVGCASAGQQLAYGRACHRTETSLCITHQGSRCGPVKAIPDQITDLVVGRSLDMTQFDHRHFVWQRRPQPLCRIPKRCSGELAIAPSCDHLGQGAAVSVAA